MAPARGELPEGTGIWGHTVGDGDRQKVVKVDVDEQRNVYVAGEFDGELHLDGITLVSAGETGRIPRAASSPSPASLGLDCPS